MNKEVKQLLDRIYDNPIALWGKPSLERLVDFVGGYQYCMYVRDGMHPNSPVSGYMQDIVLEYYDVKKEKNFRKKYWSKIIIFCEGSDEKAFYKFYELLELYEKKYGSAEELDS